MFRFPLHAGLHVDQLARCFCVTEVTVGDGFRKLADGFQQLIQQVFQCLFGFCRAFQIHQTVQIHQMQLAGGLDTEEVEASSFIALVNSAMIFRITSGHAELAAKALRLGNYTLANLEDKSQLVGILNGLATVASVSRNQALADELRILVRRYRRDSQYGITIEEAMGMCLVASAAREDLMEWRAFAGEWLTELAFGDLEGNEGRVLHSRILALLYSVPELWVSCARADAALQAWRFR